MAAFGNSVLLLRLLAMSAFILFSESFFFVIFFAWPRIGALIVFGYMLLFSTYNDSLREDQSEQNVFIGNYVGRRKIIPTIHFGNIYFTPAKSC